MANTEKNLGPLAGRWRDLWSGKVGASDPAFRALKTDIGLLETRLMKMHVGARGGEYIMQHFKEMLNAAKDSPENMRSAIAEIKQYAEEVKAGPNAPPPKKETVDYKVGGIYQGNKIIGVNKATGQLNVEGIGVVTP